MSHVLAGVLPLIWYAVLRPEREHEVSVVEGLADVTPHLGLVLLCVVFALLPDLDSAASRIGRLFPWLSRPLGRRFGHRTVTHSLLATGAVGLVTFLLFRDGWVWLTAAYFSHLALDMLVGEQGVPLLWPGPWRFYLASVRPAATGELVVTPASDSLHSAPRLAHRGCRRRRDRAPASPAHVDADTDSHAHADACYHRHPHSSRVRPELRDPGEGG